MINIQKIPGMIEPIEQNLLMNIAANIDLSNGAIIEFGTYFGKSTACLINGILNNPSFTTERIYLYSYDSFEATIGHGFEEYVLKHAKSIKLENALIIDSNSVNFRSIYDYFLGSYENKILKTNQIDIKYLSTFNKKIELIFIDCPKDYKNFIYIFEKFFPSLNKNSIIIFQDYFYFWSGTLIACIQIMLNDEMIKIKSTAASSLIVELIKPIDMHYINKVKNIMENSNLSLLIHDSRNNFSEKSMDRYFIFYPRLILANLQYAYHNNSPIEVSEIMKNFLSNVNFINNNTLSDLSELISRKFYIETGNS
jgi:hypothetical protein